ncbi:MAG: TonB-dependent receptor [Acidobacteria bacterium]|nr:TonB-dependent receptor [Acidobacteriota bacterium]
MAIKAEATLLVLLFSMLPAAAQYSTGVILGVVKDTSGAVVPDATLAVRNVETGQSRTTVTGADGSYRLSALPVGRYEVRAEHAGFRSEARGGLTLTVGQEAVVNFTLEVGVVAETVSVTAGAPLVNTTSGSLGGLVDERRMADLPLNGRNWIDLTLLQSGITEHKNLSKSGGLAGTSFSSNGAPIRSNNAMLDGAQLQNQTGFAASVTGTTLGVEGIREYLVVTNSFSAEYGMTMGSQTMIVSKGGTNAFHGSLFEYHRNDNLDARNFFDYQTRLTPGRLPEFKRNNFGASFGGPIQKDETFFFTVYEGLRERTGLTQIRRVIPPECKVDGGCVPRIAEVVKPFLPLWPAPNLPNNEFTNPFSQPTREDYGQERVDHTFSSNDSLFGRFTIQDTFQGRPVNFALDSSTIMGRMIYATLSESHIFSPISLNTFRFSYSRFKRDETAAPTQFTGPQYSCIPPFDICGINIGGIGGGFGGGGGNEAKQNIFTWTDDVFYTRGHHSWKFGTLINRYQQYFVNFASSRGDIQFSSVPNFLLAVPSRYNGITPGSIFDRTYHFTILGFYAQDNWRVRPNLTLNLGLRYEFQTTPEEVNGLGSNVRNINQDVGPTLGPVLKNPSLRNFSPRFGFAWDVAGDGKTAVRGGFGLLYDLANIGSVLNNSLAGTPPFTSQSEVRNPPTFTLPLFFPPESVGKRLRILEYNMQQPHLLSYNLTVERQLPWDMAVTLAYGGSRGINLWQGRNANTPEGQTLADGRKFWTGNEPRPNPNWDSVDLKTTGGNSWYNSFQLTLMKRLSQGLQFQTSYTFSKLIDDGQSQLNVDNLATASVLMDSARPDLDKGLSPFDVRHNLRLNGIYRFPGLRSGGVASKLLNGWWMSSILSLQSGYPFTPTLNTNRSRSKSIQSSNVAGIDRPDLVPGRNNDNIILGGPDRYFDPSAFTIPAAGYLGTAGRNILIGPGFGNLDFSLVKDTALGFLGESGTLEFRAEFFNLLNRANFQTPTGDARVVYTASQDVETPLGAAGRITSTSNTSRQIQLALKIIF